MSRTFAFGALALVCAALLVAALWPREQPGPAAAGASVRLSYDEFVQAEAHYADIVSAQDPRAALAQLREAIKSDDRLARSCHDLVHTIGHEAYEKYRDFGAAMRYQDEICNSGYLHGIIESYFASSTDIFAAIKTVCDPYRAGGFTNWECSHGVGHGLMYYTDNDLPRSLTLCDALGSDFARSSCINGVFMENFNSDQHIHATAYLKDDDSFFPCEDQAASRKADCYLYAPTHYLARHPDEYQKALAWCASAEFLYRDACAAGVGSQAVKENINQPLFVERVCMSGLPSQTASCIGGMTGLYINHYASLEPAQALCTELQPPNRPACVSAIQASASLFEK